MMQLSLAQPPQAEIQEVVTEHSSEQPQEKLQKHLKDEQDMMQLSWAQQQT